jgi:hypothetical protein
VPAVARHRRSGACAVEGLSRALAERVDETLASEAAYLGAIEIRPKPVHWVLYDQSLVPVFRVVGDELRMFYAKDEYEAGGDRDDVMFSHWGDSRTIAATISSGSRSLSVSRINVARGIAIQAGLLLVGRSGKEASRMGRIPGVIFELPQDSDLVPETCVLLRTRPLRLEHLEGDVATAVGAQPHDSVAPLAQLAKDRPSVNGLRGFVRHVLLSFPEAFQVPRRNRPSPALPERKGPAQQGLCIWAVLGSNQ